MTPRIILCITQSDIDRSSPNDPKIGHFCTPDGRSKFGGAQFVPVYDSRILGKFSGNFSVYHSYGLIRGMYRSAF